MNKVEFKNVTLSYGNNTIVRDFSLSIMEREIVGIIGPSGCGKTTIARALCGLMNPDSGEIYMDGRPFTVDEVRFFDVAFRDPTMTYPIYRAESKSILEMLLDRDERNRPFRTEPLPEQASPETLQEALSGETQPQVQEAAPVGATNFHITDDHLGEGSRKTKFAWNVAAIRTLKAIEAEGRQATPEEQEILSRYVGWGGMPQAFDGHNAS